MKVKFSTLGLALLALSFLFASCTSKPSREVANSVPNGERIRFLRQAAENRVLFLIGDLVFRDVPLQQVGSCRQSEDPIWATNLFRLMGGLSLNPQLYAKIHVIEIKRGDRPKIEIEKGNDGLAKLVIRYAKRTTFEKITPMTSVDCARSKAQYLNQSLEIVNFDWPTSDQLVSALSVAPPRTEVERFNFNKKFLLYLADRMSILKVTQKQIYDKSPSGEYAIHSLLKQLGEEVSSDPKYAQIDFWLKEISVQSKQANNLVLFGLSEDPAMAYGVKVDSSGAISRRINRTSDPSYLYLSFKESEGRYEVTKLQDLNACLVNLSRIYKARFSGTRDVANTLEMDHDSFLYPGYPCSQK